MAILRACVNGLILFVPQVVDQAEGAKLMVRDPLMKPVACAGFTLLELLVNVAIIGVLVAIAIPAYNTFREQTRIARAKQELRDIRLAIETLALDTNRWPGPQSVGVTANQEIWDLGSGAAGLTKTNGAFPNWQGPYLKFVPKDPWGKNYFFDPDYRINGVDYPVIGSFGPNKVGPNQYDADDVILILPTK